MSVQVKVECEGVGQRSHDAWPVGTFQHSPVVDWLRLDETDEENGWFLPEGTPMRHEWARNAPGARHKITCNCGQSVELSYENLVAVLNWARDNNKKLTIALLKQLMQARAKL